MNEDSLLTVSYTLRIAFLASLVLLAFALLRYVVQRRAARRKASGESARKGVEST